LKRKHLFLQKIKKLKKTPTTPSPSIELQKRVRIPKQYDDFETSLSQIEKPKIIEITPTPKKKENYQQKN